MEKINTTKYITAKKRIGCSAPTEVKFLAFISPDFGGFSKNSDRLSTFAIPLKLYCRHKNIL
jgi:hypothetical protein